LLNTLKEKGVYSFDGKVKYNVTDILSWQNDRLTKWQET
jgi:hypothetical protein